MKINIFKGTNNFVPSMNGYLLSLWYIIEFAKNFYPE